MSEHVNGTAPPALSFELCPPRDQRSEMTHASVRDTPFAVPTDLVRLSVGVENVEDLWGDLDQAPAAVASLRLPVAA